MQKYTECLQAGETIGYAKFSTTFHLAENVLNSGTKQFKASKISEPECSPNIYKLQGILGYTEIKPLTRKSLSPTDLFERVTLQPDYQPVCFTYTVNIRFPAFMSCHSC